MLARGEQRSKTYTDVRRRAAQTQADRSRFLKVLIQTDSGCRVRLISTTPLHVLPRFDVWPINLLVSQESDNEDLS